MSLDTGAFLARIRHHAAPPSPQALSDLQAAFLGAVPFENIDPFLGQIPDLDPGAVQDKILRRGRGGYCLELNGLFGEALAALGYEATPVLGRVRMGADKGGPRAHLAHVVRFGGIRHLADVGFGGPAPEASLPLVTDRVQTDRLGNFRFRADTTTGETVLERQTPEGWFALYGFDAATVTAADCVAANFYCAAYRQSPFPNHLMMNRVTETGRLSLFDGRLSGQGPDREITDARDLERVLRDGFALRGVPDVPTLWERLRPALAA